MLPLLGIVAQLFPDFIKQLGGGQLHEQSGSLQDQVLEAIKKATGLSNPETMDPKVVQAEMEKPAANAQLDKDLQEIALEELKERDRANEEAQRIEFERYRLDAEERERIRAEEFQRQLLDFQDRQVARSSEMTLAEEHNPLAWVAPILAFLLVAMIWYLLHGIMTARERLHQQGRVQRRARGAGHGVHDSRCVLFRVVAQLKQEGRGDTVRAPDDQYQHRNRQHRSRPGRRCRSRRLGAPPPQTPSGPARQTDDRSTPRWPSGSPPSGTYGLFRQKAPVVMRRLIHDVSVSEVQAAAMLGNIGWECGGFKALQEVKPVMGGIGGLGWCQWTAARRTSFVNWLRDNGWGENYHDDEANYGYLLYELHGPQRSSLNAVKGTSMVESATKTFMDIFERPNAKYAALDNRIGLARIALQEYRRAFNV